MEKKEKQKLALIYITVFLLAVLTDLSEFGKESAVIYRDDPEGDIKTIDLLLNAEGLFDNYVYEVEVEPQKLTEVEARELIKKAKEEIDEKVLLIVEKFPVNEIFVSEMVETEWYFSPSNYIKTDGSIDFEELNEERELITVTVKLNCCGYEELYQFPIELTKPQLSAEEEILQKIALYLELENEKEGVSSLVLPEEIAGIPLIWNRPREYLTIKIVFLEIVSLILVLIAQRKQKIKEQEQRNRRIELTYSEIVSQLAVLLEAGMTTRQAWGYIGNQFNNRKKAASMCEPVTEAIFHLNQKLKDGESERRAYQQMGEELGVFCYRRLMRTLTGNLEKGNMQLCAYLEEESRRAYEERVLLAKKLGEEASTKMLVPLMLMLMLVMAVVLMPAIIGFSL